MYALCRSHTTPALRLHSPEILQQMEGQDPRKAPAEAPELGEGVDDNAVTKPTLRVGPRGPNAL
jgi:hypothetical protein